MIARASGLKTPEYICYALGDAGGCLVFGLVTSILQTYYTDVLILSPFFIMVMFVLTRVWDAVNDPIMGRICDTAPVSKHPRSPPPCLRQSSPEAAPKSTTPCGSSLQSTVVGGLSDAFARPTLSLSTDSDEPEYSRMSQFK